MEKTNVMRILDSKNIEYQIIDWTNKDLNKLQENYNKEKDGNILILKTLVTIAKSKDHYVFVIPINQELDLKLAAKVVNEKNIEMIHQKELLPLTGYIHGGCSPIGMKKEFLTIFDESCLLYDNVIFSAGKIGISIQIKTSDITLVLDTKFSRLY